MGKKIIFLDIDGTLCQPGSNIPPASALEAIKKAQTAFGMEATGVADSAFQNELYSQLGG